MKCMCCKFDNCRKEFDRHRSNTAFYAVDRQFNAVGELIAAKGEGFGDRICAIHMDSIREWLDGVFAYYERMRGGVYLPKAR